MMRYQGPEHRPQASNCRLDTHGLLSCLSQQYTRLDPDKAQIGRSSKRCRPDSSEARNLRTSAGQNAARSLAAGRRARFRSAASRTAVMGASETVVAGAAQALDPRQPEVLVELEPHATSMNRPLPRSAP